MKTNSYLYGKDIEVPAIPEEIIVRRVEALKENLEELMDVPYLQRDGARVRAVVKAIHFWEDINSEEIDFD